MQLYSWNVNGIRAATKKGFLDWFNAAKPDVLCVQEIKAMPEQIPDDVREPEGYHTYWAPAERKGYSGVGLYSKVEPNNVQIGLGIAEYDSEGRTVIAEYDDFVFIGAYFPNGSRDHSRVPFKMAYKAAFLSYCEQQRQAGKSVIFCGDINTAHQDIDLARPKQNKRTTGFLEEERVWFDEVMGKGYIDTFRHFYPDKEGAYAWWSNRSGARDKNIGWRIDYFFTSDDLVPRLKDATIHADVMGSDHCPISLTLE